MINRLVSQRYEVLEKVGESPLFSVYRVRDRVLNRTVALKAISVLYAADGPFMQGLQTGLTASATLNHPNITAFLELDQEEGTPYAIFEFVRGINLKERIRRIAPFTLSAAVDVACAVGEALQLAHSLGQSHGDLRPQNIIISPEGAVKVTDFGVMAGIARSPQAQQEILRRAAPYHAPELSMTQSGTPAGDIYALGAIVYEMLTGAPIYAAETAEATADLHAFADIPSPRTMNAGVPRSIEGIVIKCLQKRPDQRYRSAADLLTDLKSVRDALRFGKPLSWSPIDIDKQAAEAVAPPGSNAASPERPREPVAAASSARAIPMPSTNRLRVQDERVSTVLKVMIGIMTSVIVLCLIGFVVIFKLDWAVPPPIALPSLVGKTVDEAKTIADRLKIKLIWHGDYMDRPRNLVYKTDQDEGKLQSGHYINVWYSKGPIYVDVPRVVGLSIDDARQRLIEAGLTVGRVFFQYNDTVPVNIVIKQTVSNKKRVLHDTAVDLVFSQGRQPEYAQSGGEAGSADNTASPDATNPDNGGNGSPSDANGQNPGGTEPSGPDPALSEPHQFSRNINITGTPQPGTPCQVRVVYDDVLGMDHPVIDEPHKEGDKVPISFTFTGRSMTLRIFYNDNQVFQKIINPNDVRVRGKIDGGNP